MIQIETTVQDILFDVLSMILVTLNLLPAKLPVSDQIPNQSCAKFTDMKLLMTKRQQLNIEEGVTMKETAFWAI